jgi:hypothetical protein
MYPSAAWTVCFRSNIEEAGFVGSSKENARYQGTEMVGYCLLPSARDPLSQAMSHRLSWDRKATTIEIYEIRKFFKSRVIIVSLVNKFVIATLGMWPLCRVPSPRSATLRPGNMMGDHIDKQLCEHQRKT